MVKISKDCFFSLSTDHSFLKESSCLKSVCQRLSVAEGIHNELHSVTGDRGSAPRGQSGEFQIAACQAGVHPRHSLAASCLTLDPETAAWCNKCGKEGYSFAGLEFLRVESESANNAPFVCAGSDSPYLLFFRVF